MMIQDPFSSRRKLKIGSKSYLYFSLSALEENQFGEVSKLPISIKILLEAAIRQYDGVTITQDHVKRMVNSFTERNLNQEIPFKPSRILLPDSTGVPVVVDLAAMRNAMQQLGKDPSKINPLVPVDIVIDHSIMVDFSGSDDALEKNKNLEFERNGERYRFLRWAQSAFHNFRVVPPSAGIVHQINTEYLASVAMTKEIDGEIQVFPDSLVGTDSHTPMVNSIGVLGWGVGGIEAEAGMLGQPLYFVIPEVVGFNLTGSLCEGVTTTDLALTITNILRKKGVVGKFVEFFGTGLSTLSIPDRAAVANMAPEYGATIGYFPVDEMTLEYLRLTGRNEEQIELVEKYYKAQGLFRTNDSPVPVFSDIVELDLSTVVPSLAGPKRGPLRMDVSETKWYLEQKAVSRFICLLVKFARSMRLL